MSPRAYDWRRDGVPPGHFRDPKKEFDKVNEFCSKWADHDGPCGTMFRPSAGTLQDRILKGLAVQRCGKSLLGGEPLGVQAQAPPEESLCGEEEDLAVGAVPEQLRVWRQHVRGVARSRQKAYAEAFSLAQMQFDAWRKAFPVAYDQAADAQGQPRLTTREAQMLGYFGVGYAEFLQEVGQIARDGG